MLRGQGIKPTDPANRKLEADDHPTGEQAYGTAQQSVGVRFYHPKESFFRPYAFLRRMDLEGQQLTISFVDEEILIEGRGLHPLYVALANHSVAWIWEQGARHEQAAQSSTWISAIQCVPRGDKAEV